MPSQIAVQTLILTRLTYTHAYLLLSIQPSLVIHPFFIAANLSAKQVVQRPPRDYYFSTEVPHFVRSVLRVNFQ